MICQVSVLYCQDYLTQFAYLGEGNPDPQMAELTDPAQQFELAVRTFQQLAGLPVTGKSCVSNGLLVTTSKGH